MSGSLHRRDFLNSVADVMEDSTFREFFDLYFNHWDEVVSAIMLLKAYQQLSNNAHEGVTKEEKIAFLRECMKDSQFRQRLASGMINFMENQMTLTPCGKQLLLDSKRQ